MQHLEEGEIHAWLDGALSEVEGARIEQHAATCKECAAMVADARGLIAGAARIVSALDHVPSGVIPKSGAAATASRPLWRALRLTPFRAAMAASLIVAAGSLIVVQRKDGELMVPRAKEIAMPMTASAPAPAPTVAPPVEDKAAARMNASPANEARRSDRARPLEQPQSVSKTTLALQDSTLLMKPAAPAAAPVPKVAAAEDQRAKKERDSILLTHVEVTAAPASAIGAGARGAQSQAQQGQTGAQGQTAAREPARDSAKASADIAFRRALPPAVQRAEGAANFAPTASASFVGCYQVADTTRWPGAFPSRFVLAVDNTSGLVQFPMKSLPTAARPDTVTIGSWRTLTPTSVRVDLNTVAFPAWFTLVRTASGITATISNSTSNSASVTRLDCPR